jgi:transcriptional regulator with XRE-family HTH domain
MREMLVEARKKARLTQAEVSKRLGRSQSFVAKYEKGERRIDIVEFIYLSRALKIDPARFVGRLSAKIRRG